MPNNELYKITATPQQKNNSTTVDSIQLTAAQRIRAKNSQVQKIGQGTTDAEGLEIVRPLEYGVPTKAISEKHDSENFTVENRTITSSQNGNWIIEGAVLLSCLIIILFIVFLIKKMRKTSKNNYK
jgi:hypothetical protein